MEEVGEQMLGKACLGVEVGQLGGVSSKAGRDRCSGRFLDSPLSLPLHIQFFRKFLWVYFQNASRFHTFLITCISATLVVSHLNLLFSDPPPLLRLSPQSSILSFQVRTIQSALMACKGLQDSTSVTSRKTRLPLLSSSTLTHLLVSELVTGLCPCCSEPWNALPPETPQAPSFPLIWSLVKCHCPWEVFPDRRTSSRPHTHTHRIPLAHMCFLRTHVTLNIYGSLSVSP